MIGQSETESSSQMILITLFSSRCLALLCLLPASSKLCKSVGQNHSSEPSRHVLTSLHPILICKVTYILSTRGIALRTAFNSFSAVVSGYWQPHQEPQTLASSKNAQVKLFFFQMAICRTKDQEPCAATSYSIPPWPHHVAYIGNFGDNHKKRQAIG